MLSLRFKCGIVLDFERFSYIYLVANRLLGTVPYTFRNPPFAIVSALILVHSFYYLVFPIMGDRGNTPAEQGSLVFPDQLLGPSQQQQKSPCYRKHLQHHRRWGHPWLGYRR